MNISNPPECSVIPSLLSGQALSATKDLGIEVLPHSVILSATKDLGIEVLPS